MGNTNTKNENYDVTQEVLPRDETSHAKEQTLITWAKQYRQRHVLIV